MKRDDGLTRQEGKTMDHLVRAVGCYAALEQQHPDEQAEFIAAIHRCQDLLAVRIARRHYPVGWPTHQPLEL